MDVLNHAWCGNEDFFLFPRATKRTVDDGDK